MWFSRPQEPKSPPSRGQTWFSKPKEPKSPLAKDIQKYGVEQSTALARERARRGLQVLREEKQHASTKVALAASEAARAKMEMKSAVAKAELKTVQVRATSATTAVQREHKKIRNARLKRVLIMADGQALARTLANWRLQANVQAARRRVAVTSAAAKETNFWSSLFGGDQKDAGAAAPPESPSGSRGVAAKFIVRAAAGRERADVAEALHRWHRASAALKYKEAATHARAVASSLKAEAIGPAEKARAGFTTAKAELESARDWVRQQEAAAQAQWADLRSIAAGTAARRALGAVRSIAAVRLVAALRGWRAAALEFALADRLRAALKERSRLEARPGQAEKGITTERRAREEVEKLLAEERHGAELLRLRLRHAEAHQRTTLARAKSFEKTRSPATGPVAMVRRTAARAVLAVRAAQRDASRRHSFARWQQAAAAAAAERFGYARALEVALRGAKATELALAQERARREAAEQALAAVAQLPSVVAAARGSPMRSPPVSPMRSPMRSPGGESTYSM